MTPTCYNQTKTLFTQRLLTLTYSAVAFRVFKSRRGLGSEASGPRTAHFKVARCGVTFLDAPCQILLPQEQGRRPPGPALSSQLRRRLFRATVLESSKQESGSSRPPRHCFFPASDFVLLDVSLWFGTRSPGAQLTQEGPATAGPARRAWPFELVINFLFPMFSLPALSSAAFSSPHQMDFVTEGKAAWTEEKGQVAGQGALGKEAPPASACRGKMRL